MVIYQNISLKPYNTFGIEAKATEFVELNTVEEVQVLCSTFNLIQRKILVLGGGSNILLTGNFEGMVIKMNLKGIREVKRSQDEVWVEAQCGEVWHEFVMHCVAQNFGGLENLSLIPGCVGAAPMQNIGAYGVEIKDTFDSLTAVDIETGSLVTFGKEECHFGYRESIFKNEARNRYIIVSVTFRLNLNPKVNTRYGAIKETLEKAGIQNPGIKDVSNAVISIRQSKLPDPKELGNSGSFFKNPEIPAGQYALLQKDFPEIPGYALPNNEVKVPAGWLIEQCGWKGKRVGNTGSHKDQALVLVNYGNASGHEIYALALEIKASVKEKFGIDISPEVNVI